MHRQASKAAALPLVALVLLLLAADLRRLPGAGALDAGSSAHLCSPEREANMDGCAARLVLIGDPSLKLPRSAGEAEVACGHLRNATGCMQAHLRDCFAGLAKQTISNLLRKVKGQHQQVCQTPAGRQRLVGLFTCLTEKPAGEQARINAIMQTMVARFDAAAQLPAAHERIPAFCCSYKLLERDLVLALERAGCGAAGRGPTQEFVAAIMENMAGDLMELLCDGHRSLDECRRSARLDANRMRELEELAGRLERGELQVRHRSVLPAILEIVHMAQPASRR